jgi:hypothetical protein
MNVINHFSSGTTNQESRWGVRAVKYPQVSKGQRRIHLGESAGDKIDVLITRHKSSFYSRFVNLNSMTKLYRHAMEFAKLIADRKSALLAELIRPRGLEFSGGLKNSQSLRLVSPPDNANCRLKQSS